MKPLLRPPRRRKLTIDPPWPIRALAWLLGFRRLRVTYTAEIRNGRRSFRRLTIRPQPS